MESLFSLDGKTAVVVGGGGVLAGEVARGMAAAGANIVVVDVGPGKAQETARQICSNSGRAIACVADATGKADLQHVLQTALSSFGSVNILLNAAGINSGTPFFEIAESEWEKILDVNLRSVFLACQVFGKSMVESGNGGSIINISSASPIPLYQWFLPTRFQKAA